MAGCFGSHPEDRAMQAELNRYLDKQAEVDKREELIESAAKDIFAVKLAALSTMKKTSHFSYSVMGDVLSDLRSDSTLIPLARAIQACDNKTAGEEIIKLVHQQLSNEAKCEAEDQYGD